MWWKASASSAFCSAALPCLALPCLAEDRHAGGVDEHVVALVGQHQRRAGADAADVKSAGDSHSATDATWVLGAVILMTFALTMAAVLRVAGCGLLDAAPAGAAFKDVSVAAVVAGLVGAVVECEAANAPTVVNFNFDGSLGRRKSPAALSDSVSHAIADVGREPPLAAQIGSHGPISPSVRGRVQQPSRCPSGRAKRLDMRHCLIRNLVVQGPPRFFSVGQVVISPRGLSHGDVGRLRANLDDAEHLLIARDREVGFAGLDVLALAFDGCADAIPSTGRLFEHARVPVNVVVDDEPACLMKVELVTIRPPPTAQ